MGWEIRFEKTVSLLIFNMAVVAFGKMEFMGWGDVLTFAGVSYWHMIEYQIITDCKMMRS